MTGKLQTTCPGTDVRAYTLPDETTSGKHALICFVCHAGLSCQSSKDTSLCIADSHTKVVPENIVIWQMAKHYLSEKPTALASELMCHVVPLCRGVELSIRTATLSSRVAQRPHQPLNFGHVGVLEPRKVLPSILQRCLVPCTRSTMHKAARPTTVLHASYMHHQKVLGLHALFMGTLYAQECVEQVVWKYRPNRLCKHCYGTWAVVLEMHVGASTALPALHLVQVANWAPSI